MSDVDAAIAAIKSGEQVYVALGAHSPSDATVTSLTASDQIVIVTLPEGAGDPAQIAAQIDAATGGEKIIAVMVGDQLYGKATRFKQGTAEGFADRASTLSKDPASTIRIFVDKVHEYQQTAAGKEAMKSKTQTTTVQPQPAPEEPNVLPVVGSLVIAIVIIAAVWWRVLRPRMANKPLAATEKKALGRLSATAKQWDENPGSLDLNDMIRSVSEMESLAAREAEALPDSRNMQSVSSSVASIAASVAAIRDEWDRVQRQPEIAAEIRDITFKHLPETMGLYLDVPVRVRHSGAKSDSASAPLLEALEAVDHRLAGIVEALDEGTLDALQVQGTFLHGKYIPNRQLNIDVDTRQESD